MNQTYDTGSEGERRLADYLTARGRSVTRSDIKTFDLKVDGRYAEVKSSLGSYAKLGFVGLTRSQYEALKSGVDFSIFIVCNLQDPDNLEVRELSAAELLTEEPTVEPTYYWYRSQLDRCRRAPGT